MDKQTIAHLLDEMGLLLELQGENLFKIRSYHNAARALENLSEDLGIVIQQNRLREIPGIGLHMAEKIKTLFKTGKLLAYENLKKSIPKGLIELLHVPGLGAKKVRVLYYTLNISNLKELKNAALQGKIAELKGFGKKTEQNILNNLNQIKVYGKRMLWWKALPIVEMLESSLEQLKSIQKFEFAGSFRRKLETIGDLDLVIASSEPEKIMEWVCQQPWIEKILSKGITRSSICLKMGIQVDIRIVPQEQFSSTLIYFTGSKEHNIHLRKRANALGWSLSEYGLAPLKEHGKKTPLPTDLKKKTVTEKQIYRFLGLDFIPPELREDQGEIEAAEKGTLPHLIEETDLQGVFHCHTTDSDGHHTLEEMIFAAQRLNWKYIGISDHSKSSYQANGLNETRLFNQIDHIETLNRSKKFTPYIFAGLECDILTNGQLDFSNSVLKELDFVIVSIHRSFQMQEKQMTERLIKAIEHPYSTMIGHLTGRLLLKREPYAINTTKVIDACIANGKIIELNAHPMRLDMDWRLWHKAIEKGLKCSINPDAHSQEDLLYYRIGVNCARKGWMRKEDVLNTFSLAKVKAFLKKNHSK